MLAETAALARRFHNPICRLSEISLDDKRTRQLLARARRSVCASPNRAVPGALVDLRDLLNRVSLPPKEVVHLIHCGAPDGLGRDRPGRWLQSEKIRYEEAGRSPGESNMQSNRF